MKRLLIILSLLIIAGCSTKGPATRFGLYWAMSERQNYDLAMSMAGMLYGAGIIDDAAKNHILSIGVRSDIIYQELKPILTAYSQGAIRLHIFEDKINQFHDKELELNATIKAYLMMIKWEGIKQ